MVPRYELGFYSNPYTRMDAYKKVSPLMGKFGTHSDIIPIHDRLEVLPDKLIIVGGEGSNRIIFQMMYDLDQPRPVGLAGGGTHDVLYNYLVKTGRVMTPEQFRDTPPDKFPDRLLYHPGLAIDHDGNFLIFNNQIGFGAVERWTGRFNRVMRFLSRERRVKWSRRLAPYPAVLTKGRKFDVYSVSSNIGEVTPFPHQDPFSRYVTHATTEGTIFQQRKKQELASDSVRRNMIPPEYTLQVQQRVIFGSDAETGKIWIDGDTIKSPFRGFVEIGRTEKAFPLVAIVNAEDLRQMEAVRGKTADALWELEREAAQKRLRKK